MLPDQEPDPEASPANASAAKSQQQQQQQLLHGDALQACLWAAFEEQDVNGYGIVSRSKLEALLAFVLAPSELSPETMGRISEILDSMAEDESGIVSFNRFMEWVFHPRGQANARDSIAMSADLNKTQSSDCSGEANCPIGEDVITFVPGDMERVPTSNCTDIFGLSESTDVAAFVSEDPETLGDQRGAKRCPEREDVSTDLPMNLERQPSSGRYCPPTAQKKPRRKRPGLLTESTMLTHARPVSCEELAKILDDCLIVDVRGSDYFGGHIPKCMRLPFEDVLRNPRMLEDIIHNNALPVGKSHVVFCCMYGECKSNLCAKMFAALLQERQQVGAPAYAQSSSLDMGNSGQSTAEPSGLCMTLEVGFLEGGVHCWVNHLFIDSGVLEDMFFDFDPEAWQMSVTVDPVLANSSGSAVGILAHVCSSERTDLLALGRSGQDLSSTLRQAKSLLAHSKEATLRVVDEIAHNTETECVGRYLAGMIRPADIELRHDEVLGRGQGGVVIQGVHRLTNERYAVKVINVDDQGRRRQLFNSLSLFAEKWMSGCEVQGVVQLESVFIDRDKVLLVLEFMDLGGTPTLLELQHEHDSESSGLPEPVLRHVASQVVVGMRTLHAGHRLHRDVKPDNILVNSKGVACLADFGISTWLDEDKSDKSGFRRAASFIGTQAYISPQRAKGQGVSFKEDIWSIGMVFYFLATGSHPFKDTRSTGELFGQLLETVKNEKGAEKGGGITLPAPEDARGRVFSPELQDMVAQCLRKRPSERPTAAELASHPFLQSVDVEASQYAWDQWFAEVCPSGNGESSRVMERRD